MTQLDAAFAVLALTLAAALVVRRFPVPAPVTMATVGLAAGVLWRHVPGLQPIMLPPEQVLFVFLPPILTTAAYSLPLGAFRRDLVAIGMLAVGLVLVTMAATAAVAHLVVGLSWPAAFVLGAIVAPPDPVAASSVGEKTGLSHRLVVILEGEGLVNDAIAIVAYSVAVAAVAGGEFTWKGAALTTARAVPTGILIGYVIGRLVAALRGLVEDVPLEVGISLFVPYLVYEVAERTGASGVLAVVTLGFVLRRYESTSSGPAARIASHTVWSAIRYASTALVFVLLGLIGGEIAMAVFSLPMVIAGVWLTLTAIAIRLLWMHTVPHTLHAMHIERDRPLPTRRELTVLGWAGMRGVVSLALALAVPALGLTGAHDSRQTIILLTVVVIVGTLIVQGATLVPLVSWLGVGDPGRPVRDERRVRSRARRAALAMLDRMARTQPGMAARCTALAERIASGSLGIAREGSLGGHPEEEVPLIAALGAQRDVVWRMRDAGRLSQTLAEALETEIDVDAMAVRGEISRLTDAEG